MSINDSVEQNTPPILTKARRVSVLVDAIVEADLSAGVYRWYTRSPEAYARHLEKLVEEFNDHVRDHRSLDYVRLHVQRVIEMQCSSCNSPWETHEEDGVEICSHCGKEVGHA